MTETASQRTTRNVILIVLVASLGYFVDIYDLLIFSIVRKQSLLDIGVKPDDVLPVGIKIINLQMLGLFLGGVLWGVLGDKLGRLKVLFGCIILYSIANFANGFVHDPATYAIVRFIAGIGLAGELGAGITLVTETMSQQKRGYGTTIVSAVGLMGAVAAVIVAKFGWRNAYFIGGCLGILLLLLRLGTFESGMFKNIARSDVSKGNFFKLFSNWKRFKKYMYCILIGAPNWYVVGVLVTLAPEFGGPKALNAPHPLDAGNGILYNYVGIAIGGIIAGLLSQWLKSRKNTMYIFLILSLVSVVAYLSAKGLSNDYFKWLCFFMGTGVGYWTIFITVAAEQFGTNLRSTVATTVPNFIRGSLIPINWGFLALKGQYGMINAGYVMMIILTLIAFFAVSRLKESFHKDLDYVELVD
ncbi:MAG TPA: MFS transporter [Mucilaginibacter sp.]|nr:MFS transporter [Mucilaginibacter sp.]